MPDLDLARSAPSKGNVVIGAGRARHVIERITVTAVLFLRLHLLETLLNQRGNAIKADLILNILLIDLDLHGRPAGTLVRETGSGSCSHMLTALRSVEVIP